MAPEVRERYLKDGSGRDAPNPYWEGKLSPENRKLLNEWDSASAQAKDFFDNIDMFTGSFDIEGEDVNLARFLGNHQKIRNVLYDSFVAYMELERTDHVVKMIEAQES